MMYGLSKKEAGMMRIEEAPFQVTDIMKTVKRCEPRK
jgi:hypothetical protein